MKAGLDGGDEFLEWNIEHWSDRYIIFYSYERVVTYLLEHGTTWLIEANTLQSQHLNLGKET